MKPCIPNIEQAEFDLFCEKENLAVTAEQAAPLRSYLELLLKWNAKINLTSASNWKDAMRSLIADSFHLAGFIKQLEIAGAPECWDLGAGGGLPGIPLRILWQEGSYHLVELREKRALFLQTALALIKLPATFAHRADAGEFMEKQLHLKKPANLILSRAFMPWNELLPYVAPYLAMEGTLLLLLRGKDFAEATPGWLITRQTSYPSPSGPRQFVALQKKIP